MRLNDLDMRVNIANDNIGRLNSDISALQTQVTNLENSVNTRFDQMGLRINDVEQNILYLQQNIQGQINLINQELARTVKKATPMPGYNPYNLGGGISAQVWMYDITTIDDSNIRFYYVQFNNISGNPGNDTDWMPLPRTFGHFLYTLHPEYFVASSWPTQALPTIYSGQGASYRLIVANTEDHIRLHYNAGPVPVSNDYLGFLLIGNASSPGPTEQDIEKMKPEELIKLTKELAFKVKQIDKSQQKVDKEKVMKETLEQMKRMADYDFIPVHPKMTQSTTKK
jgi:hypothetical protein